MFFKNSLLMVLSFFMFSGFFSYCLARPDIAPIKPTYLIALILVSAIIFVMFVKDNYTYFYPKINYWTIFYLIVFLTWFIIVDVKYDKAEFITLFLSIISVFIFVVFLSFDDNVQQASRRGVLYATLLNIFNNIYEFLNPIAFFPLDSEIGVLGRSAGFMMNPTISGLVLNLGLVLSISLVPKRLKSLFIYITFIAVFLTFSRSAILGWVIIFLCFNYTKVIEVRKTVFYIFILVSSFISLLPVLIGYIETTYTAGSNNLILRLQWFVNPSDNVDDSESERGMVARKAWDMFLDHPYLGNGLGSTVHWDHTVSTHNIYLSNLAEHGFIGFFIVPLLILSVVHGANRRIHSVTIPFAFSSLFIGFFTHNLLTDLFFLYACVLVSLMNYNSNRRV
ncbi:MAG: O-antigen ligase family protein [Methylococcales bacterium]|nr:O-antigen ligase family protein [Methylococcales bacterium]